MAADVHNGSPRAGWGQEILIVPTVEVPPTNASEVENQLGPEPSDIITGAGNIARGVDIGIVGTLRDGSDYLDQFPLLIRAVDLSAQSYQRSTHRFAPGSWLEKLQANYPGILGTGSSGARIKDPGMARLTFQTADDVVNGDTRVLSRTFTRFPDTSHYVPLPSEFISPPAGSWAHYKDTTACLFHDKIKDRLIIFNVYNNNGAWAAANQIQKLGAIIYKQGVNALSTLSVINGSLFYHNGGVSARLWNNVSALFGNAYNVIIRNPASDTNYAAPMCAAVNFNGSIYVLVTDVENFDGTTEETSGESTVGSEGCGGFYVTVYNDLDPIEDRFRPIVGPIKPSRGFATRVKGISAAALRDSCVVFVDALARLDDDEFIPVVQYARSTDMKNWGGDSHGLSQTFTLGGVEPVDLADTWRPIDFDINPTTLRGWAVTAESEVLFTSDGGKTWELEETFDPKINFHSICATRHIPGGSGTITYEAFAFTKDGIVLRRSEDAGLEVKWRIVAAPAPRKLVGLEEFFMENNDGDPSSLSALKNNMPPVPVKGVARQDGGTVKVWIAGRNVLKYSANDGVDYYYTNPNSFSAPGTVITDIEFIEKYTASGGRYRIMVAGEIRTLSGSRGQWAVVSHTVAGGIQPTPEYKLGSGTRLDVNGATIKDTRLVNDIYFNSAGAVYYGGEEGCLGIIDSSTFDQTTSTPVSSFVVDGSEILSDTTTSILSVYWYNNGVNDIFLFTDSSGTLWRDTDVQAGVGRGWLRFAVDKSPLRRITLSEDGTDNIALISGKGLHYGSVYAAKRAYANVLALPETSEYLVASVVIADPASDDPANKVEIWRSTDSGLTFTREVEQPEGAQWTSVGTYGRPTLTLMDDGGIVLTIDGESSTAQKSLWSYDNGYTWVNNEDPSVGTPLGSFEDSASSNQASFHTPGFARRLLTRSAIQYGGGPLYHSWTSSSSATLPNRLCIFRAFNWTAIDKTELGRDNNPDYAVPLIIPGRPQWLGFDDIRVTFSGVPAVEDTWEANLRYRFDARNINIESPSIYFKSADNDSAVNLRWQRNHSDVIAAMGLGDRWHVSAFALFGTNFDHATLRLSIPSYDSDTFPGTPLTQTCQFSLSARIESGSISGRPASSILLDSTKQWIPHQYKPAHRTYYISTYHTSAPNTILETLKILDNTETGLVLDIDGAVGSANAYYVFGDRMWCDGIGGTINGVTQADLYASNNKYCKWIELEIPVQPVAWDSDFIERFTIGTVLAGIKTPLVVARTPDGTSRRRFSRGFGWSAGASISENVGLSGAKSYEQFGRVAQQWDLQYNFIKWWDRDYTFRGLIDKPKRAFGFVWDNEEPHSIELVRLTTPPQFQNVSADWYDFQMGLEEVI